MLFMRVCYEVLCAVLEYYFATKVIRSLKLFSNIAIWERVVLRFWYLDMSLEWVHSFGLDFSSLRFSLRAFPLRLLYMLRNFHLKHAMNRTAMNRDQAAFKRGLISVHFASPALVHASCCIILYRKSQGCPMRGNETGCHLRISKPGKICCNVMSYAASRSFFSESLPRTFAAFTTMCDLPIWSNPPLRTFICERCVTDASSSVASRMPHESLLRFFWFDSFLLKKAQTLNQFKAEHKNSKQYSFWLNFFSCILSFTQSVVVFQGSMKINFTVNLTLVKNIQWNEVE